MFGKVSSRGFLALALIAAAALVAGCSHIPGLHHGRAKPKIAYEERPVDQLYLAGAQKLDAHRWNDAVDYFDEVERQHPYSEWARRSILMEAYAYYEANNYDDAISTADRFIQLYPGNTQTSYAYYLKSICYFEQIMDVQRDQGATANALVQLRQVTERYPHTDYAEDARLKIDMVNDQLAGKEMSVGRWYLRNSQPLAAEGRFKDVIDKYQTTSHTPEALYRLVETDLTMGLTDEARRNASVLGYNYPGDRWYSDAYNLMARNGMRLDTPPNPKGKRGRGERRYDPKKKSALQPKDS
ncbi:MAG TPA: outer membrane protein assembly factor BamD [Caulobacteraceae bacterium]|nr:outer membrane protein assembly factor BamD [Caulobacteraceae bacterium]